MSTPHSLGQLSYASFYLPPLAFGYLSLESNNPLLPYLPQFHSPTPIGGPEPIHLFWFLTAFTFLGAMQVHGVSRAIYGNIGPEKRPKHKSVHIRHSLAIVLGTDAENIPVVPCRLAHSNIVLEFLKDLVHGRERCKTGFNQLKEIGSMVTLSRTPRILYFVPMGLHRYLGIVSFVALGTALFLGAGGYAAFILIAALFVLLFRKYIWAPIPPVFNKEGLDERFRPEYELPATDGEQAFRPRIRQRGRNE